MKPDSTKNTVKRRKPEAKDDPIAADKPSREIGGRGGLDPTRFGDWEKSGRCIDF